MKLPKYIQRKRTKGFKLPPNTLCCTRPGKWGNPWSDKKSPFVGINYEMHLKEFIKEEFNELVNYDYLACWCSEDAEYCHVQHSLIPKLKEIMEEK